MSTESTQSPQTISSAHLIGALRDVALVAASQVAGQELRKRLIGEAGRLFAADGVALWRLESRERTWRIAAATGLSSDYASVALPAAGTDASSLLPAPLLVPDVAAWPQVGRRRELYEREGVVSMLILPLNIRGETAGTICCYYRTRRDVMSEELLNAAAAFGAIASVALSTERFDRLAEVARDVAGRLDIDAVVQRITDAATSLTGAQFGAFFYNVIGPAGEAYTLYTISGVPREMFSRFPMPRNTAVFAPTFAGTGIVRSPNILKDPRYGKSDPYFGMPKGHLPVVSYLAVPVQSNTGEVIGGLFFGHSDEGVFGETEEKIAEALAGHAAVALDNVRLYASLERDRTELRREETRYRSLVVATSTRQAITVATAEGLWIQDSPGWREITGQTHAEMQGRGWLDAIHSDDRDRVAKSWDASIAEGTMFEQEYRLRQVDRSYRWFRTKAVAVRGQEGGIDEWIATAIDVHEQRTSEEALAFLARVNELFASSLDYRETLKNVTFLAVPRIADWCAIDMPDASGKLHRLSVAHVDPAKIKLATMLSEKFPPDPESSAIHRIMRTGASEFVPDISDEQLVKSAKSPEHLQLMRELGLMSAMIVPLRARNEVIGAITFIASDRHFGEQDLRHAEELAYRASIAIENARLYGAAQAANKAKDEFLAMLSHELRTPMTAVLGWARLLKMGLNEADAAGAVDAIEQSATVQAQLIDDMLDVSKIMTGKVTFEPRAVDLGIVATAAIATVQPAAMAKGVRIHSTIPPVLPRVGGDEGRLQQIIWNLLANAIKFTERDGSVELRISQAGPMLELSVSDTGEGIDPSFLPFVFEAFRQGDSSTTRQHGGIGLGLAIVRSLVELHGGRIRAESKGPNRGATFTVQLPIMAARPEVVGQAVVSRPAPESASIAFPSLAGLKVLVIDDQDDARDVVTAILRRGDAEVQTASSVRDALRLFQEARPDVVVCDIAMPGEDGFVFLRKVRDGADKSRRTPILALTAFGRADDRIRALDAGFDAYLKKPVDPGELAQSVRKLADNR